MIDGYALFCLQNIKEPLTTGPDPILTEREGRDIFSLLPNILIFNQAILEDLEKQFRDSNQNPLVGDIFKRMVRSLSLPSTLSLSLPHSLLFSFD
jgi:hypothetical protein